MTAEFENRTTIPTAALAPLIEWAREFVGGDAKICGLLLAHKRRGDRIEGRAAAAAFALGRKSKGFKQGWPFVRILISPRWQTNKYPMVETYRQRAGGITYNDWKEHFIVYLTHEFRHVEQYRERRVAPDAGVWLRGIGGSLEVDAERFAIFALAQFRKSPLAQAEISHARKVETKLCPRCGETFDIATHFGFRTVNGKTIPQSYCYSCRRNHNR